MTRKLYLMERDARHLHCQLTNAIRQLRDLHKGQLLYAGEVSADDAYAGDGNYTKNDSLNFVVKALQTFPISGGEPVEIVLVEEPGLDDEMGGVELNILRLKRDG